MASALDLFDEAHDIEEEKTQRISLHLISKRHLPADSKSWPQDKIVEELNKITHLRLDREVIKVIDNLELMGPCMTNLYLQQNRIEKIENLECLPNLKFLTLSGNRISTIEGLLCLKKLKFLDLAENKIHSFDIDEIPQTLLILNLLKNPCTKDPDHRGKIIQDLPNLRQLDLDEVTKEERRDAGYTVSSSSEDDSSEEEEDNRLKHTPANPEQIFHNAMSAILLRSQNRMEEGHTHHKRIMQKLEDLRLDKDLPPSARSTPSARSRLSNRPPSAPRTNQFAKFRDQELPPSSRTNRISPFKEPDVSSSSRANQIARLRDADLNSDKLLADFELELGLASKTESLKIECGKLPDRKQKSSKLLPPR